MSGIPQCPRCGATGTHLYQGVCTGPTVSVVINGVPTVVSIDTPIKELLGPVSNEIQIIFP